MNYNQFTIEYIKSIKRNFRVELNSAGEAGVAYDKISDDDIKNLREDLERLWPKSESAINNVKKNMKQTFKQAYLV